MYPPSYPRISANATIAKAVETIEDLNTEFSQIIFEKKDIQRKLKEHNESIEEIERENSSLEGETLPSSKWRHRRTNSWIGRSLS